MAELLESFNPMKNEYGLPTGEHLRRDEAEEEEIVQEAIQEEEEEVVVEEPVEEETFEDEEDEVELAQLFAEEQKAPSEESELDRLRHEVAVLQGRLQEQSETLNSSLREDPNLEAEREERIDLSNPQLLSALGEKFSEDPASIPVFVKEYMNLELQELRKQVEESKANQRQAALYTEQRARLQQNLQQGLQNASQYGPIEQMLVQEVAQAMQNNDPSSSHVLVELQRNPALASTAEGIEGVVTRLANKARKTAEKRGLDLSALGKTSAPTRSKRMYNKKTGRTQQEVDPSQEKFETLKRKSISSINSLLG